MCVLVSVLFLECSMGSDVVCAYELVPGEPPITTAGPFVVGEVVLKLEPGIEPASVPSIQALTSRYGNIAVAQVFLRQRDSQLVSNLFPIRDQRADAATALPRLDGIYLLEIDANVDIAAAVEALRAEPSVIYAEPNYLGEADFVPDDPFYQSRDSWGQSYDDMWALKKIQPEQAWDYTQGQGVVVAVVDSGLDYNHPEISANVWMNPGEVAGNGVDDDNNGYVDDSRGYDFTTCDSYNSTRTACDPANVKLPDADPLDDQGHGTHVAGTVAAVGNNMAGMVGVAFRARIMPVKALNRNGQGAAAVFAQALVYAADNGADIINASWHEAIPSKLVADAVAYAAGHGVVIVAAAGNDNRDARFQSPARLPEVITVASTDRHDQKSDFSNWGPKIDVAAPGGDSRDPLDILERYRNVLSLRAQGTGSESAQFIVDDDYIRFRGTSMAAPHVSGAAALVLAREPLLSSRAVRYVLEGSADDVGPPGFDYFSGFGRINATRAVQQASQAANRAELLVRTVQPLSTAAASGGPLPLLFQVENDGDASADDVHLELFDGDPAAGASSIGQWVLPHLGADSRQSLSPVVSVAGQGLRELFAVVDGTRCVPEILELNNATTALAEVGSSYFTSMSITSDYNSRIQISPSVDGERIVWADQRNGNWDIYLYDLTTGQERQVTSDLHDQLDPAISGDRIVWTDLRNGNADIYLYDLNTGQERRITTDARDQRTSAISAHRIVWADNRNGQNDIYLYNLNTDLERRITNEPQNQFDPAISGERVVWSDMRNITYDDPKNSDIYLYNLNTETERRITSNSAAQYTPDIDGKRIVWVDERDGTAEIYTYDLATDRERRITLDMRLQRFPAVSGTVIVWQDEDAQVPTIRRYDLLNDQERVVAQSMEQPATPDISGERIVWLSEKPLDIRLGVDRPLPSSPRGVTPVPPGQDGAIALAWEAESSPDVRGYGVYRSLTPGGPYDHVGNTTQAGGTDAGLTPAIRYYYRVTAVDQRGGEGAFSGEVSSVPLDRATNRAPTAPPIGNQTIAEGQTLRLTLATDPDGNALSATIVPSISGAAFDGQTGVLTWTPTFTQAGVNPLAVTVTDGAATVGTSFTITVIQVNRAPQLAVVAPQTMSENDSITLQLVASDDLDEPLTFGASLGPHSHVARVPSVPHSHPNLSMNIATGTLTITTDGASGYPGLPIILTVTDPQGLSAVTNFTLTVVETPPELTGSSVSLIEGQPWSLDLASIFSDEDGFDPAAPFAAANLPGSMTFDEATHRLAWTPGQMAAGEYAVIVSATDDSYTGAVTTGTLTVRVDNPTPAIAPVSAQSVVEGQLLLVPLSVTDDDSGLTQSVAGLPSGLVGPMFTASGELKWKPAYVQSGAYTAAVTVTDPQGAAATVAIPIVVEEVVAPFITIAAAPPATVKEGHTVSWHVVAFDGDSDPLSFGYTTNPPCTLTATACGAACMDYTWIVPYNAVLSGTQTMYTFTFTVTDGATPPDLATMALWVQDVPGAGGGGDGKSVPLDKP